MTKRNTLEDTLSENVKRRLDKLSAIGALRAMYFHIENETRLTQNTHRNQNILMKRERMGVKSGVADWIIIHNGKTHFIELKKPATYKRGKRKEWVIASPKGELSDNQKLFKAECEALNIPYDVCRTITDLDVVLEDWGLLTQSTNNIS